VSELAKAEQYFLEIMDIEDLDLRLNCMNFKLKFPDLVEELKPDIEAVFKACNQAKTSSKFKGILELILAIGNYINGNTNRGLAYGFRLDALLKLIELKGNDPKKTLLHYLVEQIDKKYESLKGFDEEINYVQHAAKVSAPTIQGNIGHMKHEVDKLQRAIEKLEEDSSFCM